MARLDIERQGELQPKRMEYAKEQITKLGYKIEYETETEIAFLYEGKVVKLFPYSGWHTGQTIKDGRGISKLLRQIKHS